MTDLRCYYRARLNPIEQQAYDLICEGLRLRRRELSLGRCTELSRVLHAVNYDNPEFFFVNWLDHVRFWVRGDESVMRVSYLYDAAALGEMQQRIRTLARSIAGISDHGKALGVHDFLVTHVDYDHGGLKQLIRSPEMFSAAGPLLHGKGVCEGVSKLACCLLREKGVPCCVITGRAEDGTPHAWNATVADGKTVYTDITYDMGLYCGGGAVPHRYFALTREEMARDHLFEYI